MNSPQAAHREKLILAQLSCTLAFPTSLLKTSEIQMSAGSHIHVSLLPLHCWLKDIRPPFTLHSRSIANFPLPPWAISGSADLVNPGGIRAGIIFLVMLFILECWSKGFGGTTNQLGLRKGRCNLVDLFNDSWITTSVCYKSVQSCWERTRSSLFQFWMNEWKSCCSNWSTVSLMLIIYASKFSKQNFFLSLSYFFRSYQKHIFWPNNFSFYVDS